jgi:hypothetical protein
MLLRLTVAAMTRWNDLTAPKEADRGDSPIPTVIIWIGVAAIAVGILTWAGLYIKSFTNSAPPVIPPFSPPAVG